MKFVICAGNKIKEVNIGWTWGGQSVFWNGVTWKNKREMKQQCSKVKSHGCPDKWVVNACTSPGSSTNAVWVRVILTFWLCYQSSDPASVRVFVFYGRGMWQAWETEEMRTGLWWETLSERNPLENLRVHVWKILRWKLTKYKRLWAGFLRIGGFFWKE